MRKKFYLENKFVSLPPPEPARYFPRRRTGRAGMDRDRDRDLDRLTALPTELLAAILAMVPFHGGLMRVCRRFRDVLREVLPVPGDTIERNLVAAGVLFWRGPARAGPPRMKVEGFRGGLPVARETKEAKARREARIRMKREQLRRRHGPVCGPNPLLGTSLLHEAATPQDTVAGDRGNYEVATNTMVGSGRDTVSVFRGLDPGTMVVQTLRMNSAASATRDAGAAGAGVAWCTDKCRELADRARDMPGLSAAARAEAVALYERTREFIEEVSQLPGRQRDKKFVVFRMGVTGMPRRPQFQFNLVVPVYDYRQQFWQWSYSAERAFREAGPAGIPGMPSRTQELDIVRDPATGRVASVACTTCIDLSSDSIPHTLWRLRRGGAQQVDFPRARRTEFRLYMRNTVVATPENREQLEAEVSGLEREQKRYRKRAGCRV